MRRLFVLATCLLIAIIARPAGAQQADIIRGKVIGPDSQPIVNASINVVSQRGGISKTTKTNKEGRYNIVFPGGDDDYFLYVTAIGFTPKKQEIKRLAEEEVLIADVKLGATTLETVNVVAQNRQTASRNDNTGDVSGTDRAVGNGAVGAADAGNIAALAATIPGFQLIPGLDGNPDLFSALGLDPSQNGSSLNGAPGVGGDLPRDASVGTTIGAFSPDVSKGGSSGAQVAVTTRQGNNYLGRTNSGQGEAPQLQWTDDVGNSLNSKQTRLSAGGNVQGPIKFDRHFYTLSYQYDRVMKDVQTLFNTDLLGLNSAGVAQDSSARLREILTGLGIPVGGFGIPGGQAMDVLRVNGAIDLIPRANSDHQIQLSTLVNWRHTGAAVSQSLTASPTMNTENTSMSGQLTLRHNKYFWDKIATETWVTGGITVNRVDPYLRFPTGGVQVKSDLPDGTSPIRNLSFGGPFNPGSESRTELIGFVNQMRWLTASNKHTLKFTTELRVDNSASDASPQYGSFFFRSLEDLEAGRPTSYSRQLFPQSQDASQMVGAISLGDAWRPSLGFQMQYGLRMDANRFLNRPQFNPLVLAQFGERNNAVPNRVYFSPRVGFSWAYGVAPQIPVYEGFRPGQKATLRGMFGVFQNMGGPQTVTSAMQQTGLPGSSRTLVCNGPATPTPQWDNYRLNPFTTPTECADGSSPFAVNTPSVTMFDPSYVQTRSVRSNLNWRGASFGNRFNLSLDATYSVALNQPSSVDLNFRPNTRFILENEGGRPVFVNPSSIDSRGSIATRDSRISQDFNRVTQSRSDLKQQTAQFSVNLSPLVGNPTRFGWSVGYTIRDIRDEYYGFTNTVGNPQEKFWGLGGGPFVGGRHAITYRLSYNFWDYVSVNWGSGFQSGSRYTPMISGDVNGDNSGSNDRAFIFNPMTTDDPAVAAGIQSLLNSGSASAKECLSRQLGQFATRNSCVSPWGISNTNLSFQIHPYKLKLPPRATFTVSVSNPLAAADIALHGGDKIRGWGQNKNPEQTLLFVRGFDPATERYKYEVNTRFGATGAQQITTRTPVVLTVAVGLDIGPTRDWQGLKMALNRGRSMPGTKASEAQIKGTVMAAIPNPMASILRSADVLGLTRKQADSLAMLSRGFTLVQDSIWTPVAKYLVGLDTVYRASDAHEKFVLGREAAANYLIRIAPDVKRLLNKAQWRRLGAGITNLLEPRYLERVRAGTVSAGGGFPIFF